MAGMASGSMTEIRSARLLEGGAGPLPGSMIRVSVFAIKRSGTMLYAPIRTRPAAASEIPCPRSAPKIGLLDSESQVLKASSCCLGE